MLDTTLRGPADAALSDCLKAYRQSDYDSCIRYSARVLTLAQDDPYLVATVCWMRGGIEEMRGRRGLALRTWGYGLELARAAGLRRFEICALLEKSISSLLDWPRVFLRHAEADAALAADVRRALETHGLQYLECEPRAEGPAAGEASLLDCLDRVTVLMVLWSDAYQRGAREMTELGAAHARLTVWRELGAAQRLLFVRSDRTPIPSRFRDFEAIELGSEVDDGAGARVAHAVRHPTAAAALGPR